MIGSRGTVPTSKNATTSFLVNNRLLFECPSEIVQAFQQYREDWIKSLKDESTGELNALGPPSLGKISHIILSHLHYDHWGGIVHILHRIMLLEREKREKDPLVLIIPKNSTLPFQKRMQYVFNDSFSKIPLKDDEFLIRFLAIEIGTIVSQILRIEVIDNEKIINLDQGLFLSCKENKHLTEGSVGYKLVSHKVKLKVEKAKSLGIPFDSTLRKLQKNKSTIEINGTKIIRSDIFEDINLILGYSGDTALDKELLEFFKDCNVLIHESTYLKPNESYHLDLHTDLPSLITALQYFATLIILIPIHFSIRYTSEDITQAIREIDSPSFSIINPLEIIGIQIDHNMLHKIIQRSNPNN